MLLVIKIDSVSEKFETDWRKIMRTLSLKRFNMYKCCRPRKMMQKGLHLQKLASIKPRRSPPNSVTNARRTINLYLQHICSPAITPSQAADPVQDASNGRY